ncbi:MAG: hypothetical protein DMH00_07320 [Acidobacteria bacterium]|nr:MAG: hypothetical protein DMH00_07320 [Acidobacteriota bacterium]
MSRAARALWILGAMISGSVVLAGTESNLKGTILDKAGSPLPGVTLRLRNDTLAVAERGTVSNTKGEYEFRGLPPGSGYRVAASLASFATIEYTDVTLSPAATTTLDFTLRPATEAREYVRVQGKTDVVNTESVTASTSFTSEFIAELPILGRDYQDILTLAPGVTDVNHTGNPNIHGARDVDVVTLVDGMNTTDPFTGLYGQSLNIESIQEIEVITSAATAQFGRAQGGFANILTKSGGNEFKGTFKMFVRNNRLDGDGAGTDKPELVGGLSGSSDTTHLSFTDLKPFLSLSGAVVRDRLWYYVSGEFIQEETPIHALTQAFVVRTSGYRAFSKTTWQLSPSQKLALSVIADHETNENQGIDSLKDVKSGYSTTRGGPTYTLKETWVLTPSFLLDSSLGWFDNRFGLSPTLNPDTNGNGVLFVDNRPDLGGNGNGVLEPRERDPGEDWDLDGAYDVFEDSNHNGHGDPGEDLDGDGRFLIQYGCEGSHHEDVNCSGTLDREVDRNGDGLLEPQEDTGIPCKW